MFNLDVPGGTKVSIIVEDKEDRQPKNLAEELLRYHKTFGHTYVKEIQTMVRIGTITKKLEKFPV